MLRAAAEEEGEGDLGEDELVREQLGRRGQRQRRGDRGGEQGAGAADGDGEGQERDGGGAYPAQVDAADLLDARQARDGDGGQGEDQPQEQVGGAFAAEDAAEGAGQGRAAAPGAGGPRAGATGAYVCRAYVLGAEAVGQRATQGAVRPVGAGHAATVRRAGAAGHLTKVMGGS
ncbi:hypothetical protein GCM10009802_62970 [Streptomyces synnematoformans]|uniref:Uncharacterized protein n=1 Tax=Streptomyces synnematoformans TaxID=415721 RepID=A0ABP4KPR3_9ACTN